MAASSRAVNMRQLQTLLLILGLLLSIAAAGAPPTFCKCTCFKNSTIIHLGPEHQDEDVSRLQLRDGSPDGNHIQKRIASTSCSKCTKAFCRDQTIPSCQEATDEDIVTMCFQRDSNKDKIIVWGFILGTAGLLGWAAFKNIAERRAGKSSAAAAAAAAANRGQYSRVGGASERETR